MLKDQVSEAKLWKLRVQWSLKQNGSKQNHHSDQKATAAATQTEPARFEELCNDLTWVSHAFTPLYAPFTDKADADQRTSKWKLPFSLGQYQGETEKEVPLPVIALLLRDAHAYFNCIGPAHAQQQSVGSVITMLCAVACQMLVSHSTEETVLEQVVHCVIRLLDMIWDRLDHANQHASILPDNWMDHRIPIHLVVAARSLASTPAVGAKRIQLYQQLLCRLLVINWLSAADRGQWIPPSDRRSFTAMTKFITNSLKRWKTFQSISDSTSCLAIATQSSAFVSLIQTVESAIVGLYRLIPVPALRPYVLLPSASAQDSSILAPFINLIGNQLSKCKSADDTLFSILPPSRYPVTPFKYVILKSPATESTPYGVSIAVHAFNPQVPSSNWHDWKSHSNRFQHSDVASALAASAVVAAKDQLYQRQTQFRLALDVGLLTQHAATAATAAAPASSSSSSSVSCASASAPVTAASKEANPAESAPMEVEPSGSVTCDVPKPLPIQPSSEGPKVVDAPAADAPLAPSAPADPQNPQQSEEEDPDAWRKTLFDHKPVADPVAPTEPVSSVGAAAADPTPPPAAAAAAAAIVPATPPKKEVPPTTLAETPIPTTVRTPKTPDIKDTTIGAAKEDEQEAANDLRGSISADAAASSSSSSSSAAAAAPTASAAESSDFSSPTQCKRGVGGSGNGGVGAWVDPWVEPNVAVTVASLATERQVINKMSLMLPENSISSLMSAKSTYNRPLMNEKDWTTRFGINADWFEGRLKMLQKSEKNTFHSLVLEELHSTMAKLKETPPPLLQDFTAQTVSDWILNYIGYPLTAANRNAEVILQCSKKLAQFIKSQFVVYDWINCRSQIMMIPALAPGLWTAA